MKVKTSSRLAFHSSVCQHHWPPRFHLQCTWMRFQWTTRFHLDTPGPEADTNPAHGAWLLGGERDRPRNKKCDNKGAGKGANVQQKEKNIKWAEPGERKGKGKQTSNRKTNRNSQVLRPAIKKPISNNYKASTLWSTAFFRIQSSLHRQYLVPRFYYSFDCNVFPMQAAEGLQVTPWELFATSACPSVAFCPLR